MATDTVTRPLTVPELFAISQSCVCQGTYECHWCGAPCTDLWHHREPPPVLGVRQKPTAKRPGSGYECVGCWLWRRNSVTVRFLSGGWKDRQRAEDWSWVISRQEALAVRFPDDVASLAKVLLKPPHQFALLLAREDKVCRPQFGVVNDRAETKAGDPLYFTVDNTLHCYSVYELELALKGEPLEGLEPGVRRLASLLKPHLPATATGEAKKGNPQGGRPAAPPTAKQTTEKVIARSGQ